MIRRRRSRLAVAAAVEQLASRGHSRRAPARCPTVGSTSPSVSSAARSASSSASISSGLTVHGRARRARSRATSSESARKRLQARSIAASSRVDRVRARDGRRAVATQHDARAERRAQRASQRVGLPGGTVRSAAHVPAALQEPPETIGRRGSGLRCASGAQVGSRAGRIPARFPAAGADSAAGAVPTDSCVGADSGADADFLVRLRIPV